MKAEAITIKEIALMYFPNSTPDSVPPTVVTMDTEKHTATG